MLFCVAKHLSVCPSAAYCEVHPPQGGRGQCSREQCPGRGPVGHGDQEPRAREAQAQGKAP